MAVSREVAEKMGLVPSKDAAVQLRNICLYSIYQRNQRDVDNCDSYEDVLRLGIIPKNLQKPCDFSIRSAVGFLK